MSTKDHINRPEDKMDHRKVEDICRGVISMKDRITSEMIAPCGLNCAICKRAVAETDPCPGCHGPNENKPAFCSEKCGIILCRKRIDKGYEYCDECPEYPCDDVMEKEIRYTSKYTLYESPKENLRNIRELGMERFLEIERERWICKDCGGIISVHTGICSGCGKQYGAQDIENEKFNSDPGSNQNKQ